MFSSVRSPSSYADGSCSATKRTMRTVLMSAATALLCLAAPAQANQWDATIRGGASTFEFSDFSYNSTGLLPVPSFTRTTSDDRDTTAFISFAAGWTSEEYPIRMEAEIASWGRTRLHDSYDMSLPGLAGTIPFDLSVALVTAMANLYYIHPLWNDAKVFDGLGGGIARIETERVYSIERLKSVKTLPAASLSFGAILPLGTGWTTEVRVLFLSNLDVDFAPQYTPSVHHRADLNLTALSFGLRRCF